MKAISLWQPWASLIACGAKIHETRGWATSYRGALLIHAAKRRMDRETMELFHTGPFQRALSPKKHTILALPSDLPYGAALCVVNLADCVPTERHIAAASRAGFNIGRVMWDVNFGDFTPGRFAWRLENLRVLPEPIPMVGRQGLFNVPADVLARVEAALAAKAVA
jgi:hypothetical protein